MNNSCTRGTFSEFYPEVFRFQLRALLILTAFCLVCFITATVLMKNDALDPVQISFVVYSIVALSLFVVFTMVLHIYFLPIVGKEGMLTILDRHRILKPGEQIRLWQSPRTVETIPLEGAETIDFSLCDLSQFHDLDDFIPGLDCTHGANTLSVSVRYAWTILPAEEMDPFYFQSAGVFHSTIDTLIKSKFVQSLHLLCHNGPALSQAEQPSFSDVLEDILSERVAVWEGIHEQHPCPFHLEIQSLSLELVTTTTTRTVL